MPRIGRYENPYLTVEFHRDLPPGATSQVLGLESEDRAVSHLVGNDSMLIHETVLFDVAAGMQRMRDLGFENVIPIGNSGGGSLVAAILGWLGEKGF